MPAQDKTSQAEAARYLADRPRSKKIDLQWPVEFEGVEYRSINLVRLTAGDVARFHTELERLLKNEPDSTIRFPIFRDDAGEPIPGAVMDALDDDDKWELDQAALDFLPRRFRAVADIASGRDAGGNTEPSSAE